jgi:hypothetical protein
MEMTAAEKLVSVDDARLFSFEKDAMRRFLSDDPPDELFLLSSSPSSVQLEDPSKVKSARDVLMIVVNGDRGRLQVWSDFGEKRSERAMSAEAMRKIKKFFKASRGDILPRLDSERVVAGKRIVVASGTIYVYLHATQSSACRVWINNPPSRDDKGDYPAGDRLWDYTSLVDFFGGIAGWKAIGP